MSNDKVKAAQREATQAKSSPEFLFNEQIEKPGFVSTGETGTPWSGSVNAKEIVARGGKVRYGDTAIDLDNEDTKARIDKARSALPQDKSLMGMSAADQDRFFDNFVWMLHQPDVVGAYFPAVQKNKAEQDALIEKGRDRILSTQQKEYAAGLRESRNQYNAVQWAKRDADNVVLDSAVEDIAEGNKRTDAEIIQLETDAARDVLGAARAQELESAARKGLEGQISEEEMDERVHAELMHEASLAMLSEEESTKLDTLKQEEDQLWQEKHANQKDFSDAINDGNPDCSEYTSAAAVSFELSDVPNLQVSGHVMQDSDYPMVGAHAYNVILDQSGQNIVGVFEGTATSGAFRRVMNDVSLAEFQAGQTLVTYNEKSGWATYGTGAPAAGKNLDEFLYDAKTNTGEFVSDVVERTDVALISEAKMKMARDVSPEMVADKLIDTYAQYGSHIKVQGWIDMIRDEGNPAFAQAAQVLQDYKGAMPPPENVRERIVTIVEDAQNRALAQGDSTQAITMENVASLDQTASSSLASTLDYLLDSARANPDKLAELSQSYPWMAEAVSLMDGRPGYIDTLLSIDENRDDYDAWMRLQNIVYDNNISVDDLNDIRSKLPDQGLQQASRFDYGLS